MPTTMRNRRKNAKIELFCQNLNCGERAIFFFFIHQFALDFYRIHILRLRRISKYSDLCRPIFCVNQNKFLPASYKNPLIYENNQPIFFTLLICLDQWFSNWGPRSFWGPRDNFLGPRSTFQKN